MGYNKDGKPYAFNLHESQVTALFCSTNQYGKKGESEAIEVTCQDKLINNSNNQSKIPKI